MVKSKQRVQGVTELFLILSCFQLKRDGKSKAVNKTTTSQRDTIRKSASSRRYSRRNLDAAGKNLFSYSGSVVEDGLVVIVYHVRR